MTRLADYDSLTDEAIKSLLNEDFIKDDPMSAEEKTQLVRKAFTQQQERIVEGYKYLLDDIQANQDKNKLNSSIFPYLPNEKKLKWALNRQHLSDELNKEHDYASIFGFRDDAILFFYEIACKFMNNLKLKEATSAFNFLCFIKPYVSIFWLEYARCE